MNNPGISRRAALQYLACGFGSLALADLLHAAANPLRRCSRWQASHDTLK
jgi:hypothetical protein